MTITGDINKAVGKCGWKYSSSYYRHKTSSAGKGKLRTMEALMTTSPTPDEEQKKGRHGAPLLRIPLANVVPDELHLMLRITDVLTRNLVKAVLAYNARKSPTISNVLQIPFIKKLLKNIRECGVGFHIYMEEDGGFKSTSLVGGDKKKLLKLLPRKLLKCQPQNYRTTVKKIWEVRISSSIILVLHAFVLLKDFANLYETIKGSHSSSNVARIHRMVCK